MSKMVLSPRESAQLISRISKHVNIVKEGIEKTTDFVIKSFQEENIDISSWKKHPLNPKNTTDYALDWIFVADSLNFSFWSQNYKVTYHGDTYTGYWSLCAAINRAIEEGYNITSPAFYSNVSMETLQHIFRSDTEEEMPLLAQRHNILNETGKCLVEGFWICAKTLSSYHLEPKHPISQNFAPSVRKQLKIKLERGCLLQRVLFVITKFEGTFINCLKLCDHSAQKLLKLVIDNFPSYKDEAVIDGHNVSFYKRAQILIGDIWCCFEGKDYGDFKDIDSITMFADYRIPQALVYSGVLEYSDELKKALEGELENGSRMEVEIRGCSIWAVELICQRIKEKQNQGIVPKNTLFNPILVDNFLWDYRRKFSEEMDHIPFHKTRCIYY